MIISEPLIRCIDETDFRAVAEITNKHFPHMLVTPSKIALRLSRGFSYFVAVVEGAVVGFIEVKLEEKKAKLLGMAVDDRFKGRGIGSALINKAIEFAVEEGKREIYLEVRRNNLSAIKVYERHGFVLKKELEKDGEGVYIMRRSLET